MADYHPQDRRGGGGGGQYGGPPPGRPGPGGPGPGPATGGFRREAAYSDIFGAPPPPGRSHTFNAASQQSFEQMQLHMQMQQQQQQHSRQGPPDSSRTQTMTSTAPDGLPPRQPAAHRRPLPPQEPYQDHRDSPPTQGQPWPPPPSRGGTPGGALGPEGGDAGARGYYPPRSVSAGRPPGPAPPSPLPPQHGYPDHGAPAQQQRPGWRPAYDQDGPARGPPSHLRTVIPLRGPPGPMAGAGGGGEYYQRGLPANAAAANAAAAMYSDPTRTRSLASMPRPGYGAPSAAAPAAFGPAAVSAAYYNQSSQAPPRGGPPLQNSSRTTAQGRLIPGRPPPDDRTMSLTGYPPQPYSNGSDNSSNYNTATSNPINHTIISGRVVPNRRPNDDPAGGFHQQQIRQQTRQQTPPYGGGYSDGYGAGAGLNNGYGPPKPRTASITSSIAGSTLDGDRTMSMASTTMTGPDDQSSLAYRRSTRSVDGERPPTAKVRPAMVYPALLSRVAVWFRRRITTGDRTKNELTYHHAFSGAEAVDVLSHIIRTSDRNLALLLGRALDAQKYFHDVTYEHRLRDSATEMYQFRESLVGEDEEQDEEYKSGSSPTVNGVFVLLSDCYSPTCTRDQLCYSIACPRRLEQVSRLNFKSPPPPGLNLSSRATAAAAGLAAGDDDADDKTDEQKLWINSVPADVASSVSEREKKRQEVISEICYTERDFVKDLEYLRDFWIVPLRSAYSPVPAPRRDRVVRTVFSNIIDPPAIHAISSRFAKSLTDRQQREPVVRLLGDIFLDFVPQFGPFIYYGARQLEAKFEFENERATNPAFSKFVDDIERRKESRKLELNGYLTKPTTRLARYPLLLENVLKYTEEGSQDLQDLPRVLVMIRDLLSRVNTESGRAENRFNLRRLHEQLKFKPGDRVDLRLTDDGRELVYKSLLRKGPTDPTEITAFLFDHAVLLVRVKQQGKTEEVKSYRRPIPLELLYIREMDEVIPSTAPVKRSSSSLIPSIRGGSSGGGASAGGGGGGGDAKKSDGWPITFQLLGKNGYELTLFAPSQSGRKKWLEFIDSAQQRLRSRADFFNSTTVSAGYFGATNKVNCAVPFDGGRRLLYGTDNGLYVSDRKARDQPPRRVIEATSVTQVDILEEYQLLLVLANKSLQSYPLSVLLADSSDGGGGGSGGGGGGGGSSHSSSVKPKKIQSHCSYFRTGVCLGRHLVCCLKPHAMSTTIKVFEPNDAMLSSKKQKGFGRFINAGQDELKAFKEVYIPAEAYSVHFLKSKLCVSCSKGFEVVSLETLETQSLLDQADTSLDFVARRESVRPVQIERLNGEFLLNYSDFSFFVNRNGWRSRPEWRIDWEGNPVAFALSYPWILAFETDFIELRSIESGAVHIVPHKNIRMLHSSTHEILFAYEDEKGGDVIESIDFWTRNNNRKSEFSAPATPATTTSATAPALPPIPSSGSGSFLG